MVRSPHLSIQDGTGAAVRLIAPDRQVERNGKLDSTMMESKSLGGSSAAGGGDVRVEDDALVRGAGRFADDALPADCAFAVFVRSPHACAKILSVNCEPANAYPGVLCVLTSSDVNAEGARQLPAPASMPGRREVLRFPLRPVLPCRQVYHVGEAVACVVADSVGAAIDASELIEVEYEARPSVTTATDAIRAGAPQLWPDIPGNVALDWPGPMPNEANEREIENIIASADRVARLSLVNQRLIVASLEPRGATASYAPDTDRFTLRCCSQSASVLRNQVADAMGVAADRLRVITEDVGGAFGMKTGAYPEYICLLVAAKRLRRPVHWMSTRSEAFLSDNQARDTVTNAELALDSDGRFLALRVRHLANQGAYVSASGVAVNATNFSRCFPSMYDIARIDVGVVCVLTNTAPTGPYRGAGRPEANYVMERLVDEASRITGIERSELRARNLITPSQIPYSTAVGTTYDSGDFPAVLAEALAHADHAGFPQRKKSALRRKRYRGIGISCFVEHAGAAPTETVSLAFSDDDVIEFAVNVQATGQGHQTVFARLLATQLGLCPDRVRPRGGDSDLGVSGYASVGSRSAMVVSHGVVRAADAALKTARTVAASVLEAAEADLVYADGKFRVAGTDHVISLFDVAAHGRKAGKPLDTVDTSQTPQTFPNGCHIAEVEIDPETGNVTVERYVAVDDCGRVLNEVIAEGQIHGGLAQGLGQALLEEAIYERTGGGQLLTGSFMDYALPRANDMTPNLTSVFRPTQAMTNPMGVKGVGEAGATGAIAALINAIADALPPRCAHRLQMPATPAHIWKLLHEADHENPD